MEHFDTLKVLQLESTALCNARCVMCPHGAGTMPKRAPYFDEELFRSLLHQAKEMQVWAVTPFLTGEIFVFPRWQKWLTRIAESGFKTFLYTNAALMRPSVVDALKRLPDGFIQQLVVSHHAVTPETERKVTGLNFYDVEFNVEYLKAQKDLPFSWELHFVETEHNTHERAAWEQKWGYKGKVIPFFTYGGRIHDATESHANPQQPCTRLLEEMTVLSDGRVSLCCMDGSGDVILGNLKIEPLKAVWERAQVLRNRHKALDFDMPLCKDCNMNRYPKGHVS
jgi:radical SAM protein with 4Fe4S-binding SPASM domain